MEYNLLYFLIINAIANPSRFDFKALARYNDIDEGLVKSRFADDSVKSSKFKARESRVTRRTDRKPQ